MDSWKSLPGQKSANRSAYSTSRSGTEPGADSGQEWGYQRQGFRMDLCGIFLIPDGVVAAGERDRKIDLHPQRNPGGASRLPVHLGMSCSAPGEDRPHRPVATAEHPLKGLVIGEAGLGQPPGWVWIPIRSNSAGGGRGPPGHRRTRQRWHRQKPRTSRCSVAGSIERPRRTAGRPVWRSRIPPLRSDPGHAGTTASPRHAG